MKNGSYLRWACLVYDSARPLASVMTLAAGLAASVVAEAVPLEEFEQVFTDPTGDRINSFGNAVALSTDYVLIGDSNDRTQVTSVGQAHLFAGTSGTLLHTFNDPTPTQDDVFGRSVAVSDNLALIGAPGDATNGLWSGQAYLFETDSGTLLRTIDDPTPTFDSLGRGERFASSVALSGNHVLIGSRGDNSNGRSVGQAYMFDASSGTLLHTFDDPSVTDRDNFGSAVAVSNSRVLVGASGDSSNGRRVGQAHLFDAATGALLHTFDDPTPTLSDGFGGAVALSEDYVLIGADEDATLGLELDVGQVHLFDAATWELLHTFDDPTPTPGGNGGDQFGFSVALSGNTVLVGAFGHDAGETIPEHFVGQAHLFDAATGQLLLTIDDPTPTSQDAFGRSVALLGDRALISAPGDGTDMGARGQAFLFALTPVPGPSTFLLLAWGAMGGLLLNQGMRRHSLGGCA